ncbi:unnamed protein product [Parajaminaea phylloscopi]
MEARQQDLPDPAASPHPTHNTSAMKYLSTRGGPERLSFEEAVLRGLAPNGGLYIPETMPTLPQGWAEDWADLSFSELSFRILRLFIPERAEEGGIASSDLQKLVERSYSTFRHPSTTPLVQTGKTEYVLELWHGPTFAFKDVALQFLGNLFEFFLARKNAALPEGAAERHRLTVLGATSGDTGSAAISGLRSKRDVEIFILHPKGRVSPIQEAQMTTVLDENVHNLAVEGSFDDCQDIVKALFSDADFNAKHHLGAINSINFARILAQIVYYFSAYFQLCKQLSVKPDANTDAANAQFVVPTGNFGDVLAGYYAKRLGLPIKGGLVVATNENDILQRFWSSGRYEKASRDVDVGADQTSPAAGSSDGAQAQAQAQVVGGVKQTLSPAMDILVSSNFERLLWYIAFETLGQDAEKAGQQVKSWMDELKSTGSMQVTSQQLEVAKRDFSAHRVSDSQTRDTIQKYFTASTPYLLDPHTAVGMQAANWTSSGHNQVVLSTAHPAKFSEAVTSALASSGVAFDFERDVLPVEMKGLLEKERRVGEVKVADGGESEALPSLIKATAKVLDREAEKKSASSVAGKGTESV